MAWGVFKDILQFREENAPAVEELAAQEEDIGEPSSPRAFTEDEPPIANEDLTVVE